MTRQICAFVMAMFVLAASSARASNIGLYVSCEYASGAHHLPALPDSTHDALLVRSVLDAEGKTSKMLAAEGNKLVSKEAILSALQASAQSCTPSDDFFFFFSGHGQATRSGGSVLLPETCSRDNDDPAVSGISIDQIEKLVAKTCNARAKYLILDACYSGGKPSVAIESIVSGKSIYVLAASGPDEPAYCLKSEPYSVFTRALCKAITDRGSGREGGISINIEDLSTSVNHELDEICTREHLPRQNPTYRYEAAPRVHPVQVFTTTQPKSEILDIIQRPIVDLEELVRLKKGVGVVFVADNADVAAQACSKLRQELLRRDQTVFGPERSAELSSVIDKASTLEAKQLVADLTDRFLIRGKLHYESTKMDVNGEPYYKVVMSIQASLLDIQGKILAEYSGDPDGRPIIGAGDSPEIALQAALAKALKRLDPLLNQIQSLTSTK